jgi:hypothetical protein
MVSSCNLRDSQLESKVITDYHHIFVYYDQLSTQYRLSKGAIKSRDTAQQWKHHTELQTAMQLDIEFDSI